MYLNCIFQNQKKSKLLVIDGTEEAEELHMDFDYHPKRQIQHDPPPFDLYNIKCISERHFFNKMPQIEHLNTW